MKKIILSIILCLVFTLGVIFIAVNKNTRDNKLQKVKVAEVAQHIVVHKI